jgi:hypothetical protein
VQCSSGFKSIPGRAVKSTDYICLVRHAGAVCDELYVRRVRGAWVASLRRRGVDCVLPL